MVVISIIILVLLFVKTKSHPIKQKNPLFYKIFANSRTFQKEFTNTFHFSEKIKTIIKERYILAVNLIKQG